MQDAEPLVDRGGEIHAVDSAVAPACARVREERRVDPPVGFTLERLELLGSVTPGSHFLRMSWASCTRFSVGLSFGAKGNPRKRSPFENFVLQVEYCPSQPGQNSTACPLTACRSARSIVSSCPPLTGSLATIIRRSIVAP